MTTLAAQFDLPRDEARPAPPPPKPDWPLMSDILTARLDRPELLRLWAERVERE